MGAEQIRLVLQADRPYLFGTSVTLAPTGESLTDKELKELLQLVPS